MVEIRTPITVEAAIAKVMKNAQIGQTETISIDEANGRYLAEDLIAREPVPPFDRSMMDGFAVRSGDTTNATLSTPITLHVIEETPAGFVSDNKIQSGEAIRVMTGAPIPEGADAVIQLEKTIDIIKQEQKYIQIDEAVKNGNHLTYKGEYTNEGEIIARKGERISAGIIAMLATFGYARINVYKKPKVGIFATGTELLEVGEPLQPGKIRNSNSYMIQSQVERIGAVPIQYGFLPDDFDLCFEAVVKALQEVDILITTGGASVGDYDHVGKLLEKLEADVLFNKVSMRPGSVTTVAVKEDQWIFGLSGNPVSCFVGFELFAHPVIKTALGNLSPHLQRSRAILKVPIPSTNSFTRFIRGKVELDGHKVCVQPVGIDKPAVISALVESNAFIVAPGQNGPWEAGEEIEIIWLEQ